MNFEFDLIKMNFGSLFEQDLERPIEECIEQMVAWGYHYATSQHNSHYKANLWCCDTIGRERFMSEWHHFFFLTEEEAVMFSLVWA